MLFEGRCIYVPPPYSSSRLGAHSSSQPIFWHEVTQEEGEEQEEEEARGVKKAYEVHAIVREEKRAEKLIRDLEKEMDMREALMKRWVLKTLDEQAKLFGVHKREMQEEWAAHEESERERV